jgi:hypothetical protein
MSLATLELPIVGEPLSHFTSSPVGWVFGHGVVSPVCVPTYEINGQAMSVTHPWQAPPESATTAMAFDAVKG